MRRLSPLLRTEKFVYTTNETFHANIEIAHFGAEPLQAAKVCYRITDAYGKVYSHGVIGQTDIPIGNLNHIGQVDFPLKDIPSAMKLNIEVQVEGTDAVNDWDFWIYPESVDFASDETIYQTDTLDNKAREILEKGGKVLIKAGKKVTYGKEVVQYFTRYSGTLPGSRCAHPIRPVSCLTLIILFSRSSRPNIIATCNGGNY